MSKNGYCFLLTNFNYLAHRQYVLIVMYKKEKGGSHERPFLFTNYYKIMKKTNRFTTNFVPNYKKISTIIFSISQKCFSLCRFSQCSHD